MTSSVKGIDLFNEWLSDEEYVMFLSHIAMLKRHANIVVEFNSFDGKVIQLKAIQYKRYLTSQNTDEEIMNGIKEMLYRYFHERTMIIIEIDRKDTTHGEPGDNQ